MIFADVARGSSSATAPRIGRSSPRRDRGGPVAGRQAAGLYAMADVLGLEGQEGAGPR